MSFVGDLFSGSKGAGFQAGAVGGNAAGSGISGTNIQQAVTPEQAQAQALQAQQALAQQQGLVNALGAQNGLGNQSAVFNQLQGVANGTGPNPAQAQLNQSTAQNIAQQGALMGSQRGAGANTGLLARQIAQNGAGIQQQAAGQAATMQANQQLNAMNQLGGLANTQAANQIGATNQYNQGVQNEQQQQLNAIQGQNNANVAMQSNINNSNVGMQSNINNANASIANTNAGNQQNTLGSVASAFSGPAALLAKKGMSNNTPDSTGQTGGGTAPGGSTMAASDAGAGMAKGGLIKGYADGGNIQGPSSMFGQSTYGQATPVNNLAASSQLAQANMGAPANVGSPNGVSASGSDPMSSIMPLAMTALMAARGGKVPVMVSPGERYVKPNEVKEVADGKKPVTKTEKIPGKAKVSGNSYANDTVPRQLESGGIVVPKSVMESKDPVKNAAAFVAAHMAKTKRMPKKS